MAKGNFFSELKRRNVYRVGAAYVVAAFVLIEVVSNVAPVFNFPGWIAQAVILLLIIGLPAVLCFAWVYEITPEGVKRTAEVEQDASVTHQTGHRLNIVIIALMVILAGLYGAQLLLVPDEAADQRAGSAPAGSISIAVLPFVNLSGDPGQEFFSDGMTEEITSALAKVTGLQVVGRTSAFEFKGQNKDLRAIGQALGAANILEGSVRKEGNQIRVTAQLIRADNGRHIWTDNYDRELKGVFAIQDDIAQAIAGALQMPLGLKPGETLVSNRDISPENYEQYLRALALIRGRGVIGDTPGTKAVSLLEPLVVNEPRYAPGWALLGSAYRLSLQEDPLFFAYDRSDEFEVIIETASAKARVAALRAIDLDPRSADGYSLFANAQPRGNLLATEVFLKQALQIDPLNRGALGGYSIFLARVGRVKEAIVMQRKFISIASSPLFNSVLAMMLGIDGQNEAALALANALPLTNDNRAAVLARTYAAMGKYGDAADAILSTPAGGSGYGEREAAAALLREAPYKIPPQDLPDLKYWAFVYLYVGAPERAGLGGINRTADINYLWPHPSYAPVRKTAAFKDAARKAGLVDYWRARGWPDVCRPVGADDFECD